MEMYILGTILSALHVIVHLNLLINEAQVIILYPKCEPGSLIVLFGETKLRPSYNWVTGLITWCVMGLHVER